MRYRDPHRRFHSDFSKGANIAIIYRDRDPVATTAQEDELQDLLEQDPNNYNVTMIKSGDVAGGSWGTPTDKVRTATTFDGYDCVIVAYESHWIDYCNYCSSPCCPTYCSRPCGKIPSGVIGKPL